jgi:hypothetical protein
MRIRKRFYAVTLLAAAGVAAPAQAQVTGTQITTPADPHHVLFNTLRPARVAVSGTATGTGTVDLVCVRGSELTRLGGTGANVPVAADGTFSVPNASLDEPAGRAEPTGIGRTCRLHAVPAGTTPANLTRYRGPVLHISKFSLLQLSGAGDNDGLPAGFYVYAAGHGRAVQTGAFGACGVGNVLESFATFEPIGSGIECSGSPYERFDAPSAGIEVDDEPAYAPAAIAIGIGGGGVQGNSGFPAFSVPSVEFDQDTGALTVTETSSLAKCAPENTRPVFPGFCTRFEGVPVEVTRTTAIGADRQHVTVVDRWSSTDDRPHRLDLRLLQAQCFGFLRCGTVTYRFPDETEYARHDANDATPATGTVRDLAARKPIFTRDADEALRGGGAIIPEQPADRARFVDEGSFVLAYDARTIPAGGELTLTHHNVTTNDADQLEALTAAFIASLPVEQTPSADPRASGTAAPVASPPARPRLSRRGGLRVRRAGRTFLVRTGDRVECPAGGAGCAVGVRASLGAGVLGSSRTQVAAGRTAALSFRLRPRGARQLKRLGSSGTRRRLTEPASGVARARGPAAGRARARWRSTAGRRP